MKIKINICKEYNELNSGKNIYLLGIFFLIHISWHKDFIIIFSKFFQ